MVFKDSITGQILLKKYVKHETNRLYIDGIEQIKQRGIKVQSIICDGRRGLLTSFGSTPIQMCNFHQMAILRRYLTKNPKMQASKELYEHACTLVKTDKESFEGGLLCWYDKWKDFLNERTTGENGRSWFTHKRLRSAFRSLKTNLPWLFTWYDHIELQIPNTTNALEGDFSHLKTSLRNHNGLATARKIKFINEFFKA